MACVLHGPWGYDEGRWRCKRRPPRRLDGRLRGFPDAHWEGYPNDRPREESSMSQDARVETFVTAFEALRAEVEKVIVGHREIITHVLTSMFAGGHVLLEGVPGLGKTLLIKTLAEGLELSFSRIQFTPDLMPPTSSARTSSWRTRTAGSTSSSSRGRSSPTSSSRTRSTVPRQRPSRRCSRECRRAP